MIVLAIAVTAVCCYVMLKIFYKNSRGGIPGPMALPIIGHLHLIGGSSLHKLLRDMSHKYGAVFRLKLGSRETVVLSTRHVIQEAFVKQAKTFAARPNLPTFAWTRNGQTGLSLCTNTDEFKVNKSIAISALHNFLGNPNHVDVILKKEMNKMVKDFNRYASMGTPFVPFDEFRKIVPQTFVSLLFSNGAHCDTEEVYEGFNMEHVRETYSKWFAIAEADNLADYFPFLLNFPNERLKTVTECVKIFEAFSIAMIDRYSQPTHKHTDTPTEEEEESNLSLFDTLVIQYGKKKKTPLTRDEKIRFAKVLSDMIGAGFDTGAATLSWALLYLIKQPDVLLKCREEIKTKNCQEGGGFVSTAEMKSLPYTCATLYDILRLSTVAPLGLAHEVARDTQLMDFHLTKGTMVLPNLWQANHEPDRWETPETLNPGHFLTPKGELDMKAVCQLSTFSSGVRSCPGKDIALSTTFVTLCALIHNFDMSLVNGPEDLEPERGLTLKPKTYSVLLKQLDVYNREVQ